MMLISATEIWVRTHATSATINSGVAMKQAMSARRLAIQGFTAVGFMRPSDRSPPGIPFF